MKKHSIVQTRKVRGRNKLVRKPGCMHDLPDVETRYLGTVAQEHTARTKKKNKVLRGMR